MIEFKGTTEESWINSSGSRVKDIMKRLRAYKKSNPSFSCPLIRGKK